MDNALTQKSISSPLFTIVTASFNSNLTLERAISSVISQKAVEFEYIIIDGGSKDGSVKTVQKFLKKIAYFVSEPDSGIYSAFNKGIRASKGEWICFLGSDDYFLSDDILNRCASVIQSLPPNVGLLYTKVIVLNRDGQAIIELGESWDNAKHKMNYSMAIPHPGLFVRRKLFEKYGEFDETFKIAADYDFVLRVIKHSEVEFRGEIVSVGMRFGGISSDPNNTLNVLLEAIKALRKNDHTLPKFRFIISLVATVLLLMLTRLLGWKRAAVALDFLRKIFGLKPYLTKI